MRVASTSMIAVVSKQSQKLNRDPAASSFPPEATSAPPS